MHLHCLSASQPGEGLLAHYATDEQCKIDYAAATLLPRLVRCETWFSQAGEFANLTMALCCTSSTCLRSLRSLTLSHSLSVDGWFGSRVCILYYLYCTPKPKLPTWSSSPKKSAGEELRQGSSSVNTWTGFVNDGEARKHHQTTETETDTLRMVPTIREKRSCTACSQQRYSPFLQGHSESVCVLLLAFAANLLPLLLFPPVLPHYFLLSTSGSCSMAAFNKLLNWKSSNKIQPAESLYFSLTIRWRTLHGCCIFPNGVKFPSWSAGGRKDFKCPIFLREYFFLCVCSF